MAAETLQVERVSLWRFDAERSAIVCLGSVPTHRRRLPIRGTPAPPRLAPAYFDAIERERVIAAHEARTDARTREFTDVVSRAARHLARCSTCRCAGATRVIGVLCAEHVGGAAPWTVDEQNFAVSTANLIAVAIADERRPRGADQSRRKRCPRPPHPRHRARRLHRHGRATAASSPGTRRREQTFGWTRDEAIGRSLAETIIPPGLPRSARAGHAALPRHRRGARREPSARAARAASQGPRVPDRDHDHARRCGATMGFFFGAFLRDISDRLERDEHAAPAPRTPRKRRRARRASSSPT